MKGFSSYAKRDPGVNPDSYTLGTESFTEVKQLGLGVNHPPHLDPRLKKE
jgi:hypothetical protein